MPESNGPSSIDEAFDRIASAYTELGLAPDIVAGWSLPRSDATRLIEEMAESQPMNILEIGTFVGFSTLLMATYAPPGATIHSVDPNFTLNVELDAMNTGTTGSDVSVRPQEVALRAARALNLERSLTFHDGGFSTGATFSSMKSRPTDTVPIIGRQVCERHGPFDLVFIDGLHYADAVLSDVRLASRHLTPDGRIVLHDLIGMWGSNVRRAVYQFILERPEFLLRHGKYSAIYDAIGVLERRDSSRFTGGKSSALTNPRSVLARPEFVTNLASIIIDLCRPQSVTYFGRDHGGLLARLRAFGVAETHEVGPQTGPGGTQFEFDCVYSPPNRVDLCIVLGYGDHLDTRRRENLLESCVAMADTVLWAGSPPGETGEVGDGAQPVAWWTERFLRHQYVFHDIVRGHLEPLRFAFSFTPTYPVVSSELNNLHLVRRVEVTSYEGLRELMGRLLVEKESRIEDLSVQGVFSDIVVQDTLQRWRDAQRLYEETSGALTQRSSEHERTTQLLESVRPELAAIGLSLRAIVRRLEPASRWTVAKAVLPATQALLSRIAGLQQRLGGEPPPDLPSHDMASAKGRRWGQTGLLGRILDTFRW